MMTSFSVRKLRGRLERYEPSTRLRALCFSEKAKHGATIRVQFKSSDDRDGQAQPNSLIEVPKSEKIKITSAN